MTQPPRRAVASPSSSYNSAHREFQLKKLQFAAVNGVAGGGGLNASAANDSPASMTNSRRTTFAGKNNSNEEEKFDMFRPSGSQSARVASTSSASSPSMPPLHHHSRPPTTSNSGSSVNISPSPRAHRTPYQSFVTESLSPVHDRGLVNISFLASAAELPLGPTSGHSTTGGVLPFVTQGTAASAAASFASLQQSNPESPRFGPIRGSLFGIRNARANHGHHHSLGNTPSASPRPTPLSVGSTPRTPQINSAPVENGTTRWGRTDDYFNNTSQQTPLSVDVSSSPAEPRSHLAPGRRRADIVSKLEMKNSPFEQHDRFSPTSITSNRSSSSYIGAGSTANSGQHAPHNSIQFTSARTSFDWGSRNSSSIPSPNIPSPSMRAMNHHKRSSIGSSGDMSADGNLNAVPQSSTSKRSSMKSATGGSGSVSVALSPTAIAAAMALSNTGLSARLDTSKVANAPIRPSSPPTHVPRRKSMASQRIDQFLQTAMAQAGLTTSSAANPMGTSNSLARKGSALQRKGSMDGSVSSGTAHRRVASNLSIASNHSGSEKPVLTHTASILTPAQQAQNTMTMDELLSEAWKLHAQKNSSFLFESRSGTYNGVSNSQSLRNNGEYISRDSISSELRALRSRNMVCFLQDVWAAILRDKHAAGVGITDSNMIHAGERFERLFRLSHDGPEAHTNAAQTLQLQGVGLGVHASKIVSSFIKKQAHFTELKLGRNSLGDAGIQPILKLLKKYKNSNTNFTIPPSAAYNPHRSMAASQQQSQGDEAMAAGGKYARTTRRDRVEREKSPSHLKPRWRSVSPPKSKRPPSNQELLIALKRQGSMSVPAGVAGQNSAVAQAAQGIEINLSMPPIRKLNISFNSLTPQAFIDLARVLPNSTLRSLDVGSDHASDIANRMGEEGAVAMAKAVASLTCPLQELRIAGVGSVGFLTLIKQGLYPACQYSQLQLLDIRGNWLSNDAFNLLMKSCIKGMVHLSHLTLAKNRFSNHGANLLFDLVRTTTSLKFLDLSMCCIESHAGVLDSQGVAGKDFYTSFFESMARNKHYCSIEELIFDENNVGDEGSKQIGMSLALLNVHVPNLRSLSLVNCNMSDVQWFSYGLSRNTSLTKLNLTKNPFGDGGSIALSLALQGRLDLDAPLQPLLSLRKPFDGSEDEEEEERERERRRKMQETAQRTVASPKSPRKKLLDDAVSGKDMDSLKPADMGGDERALGDESDSEGGEDGDEVGEDLEGDDGEEDSSEGSEVEEMNPDFLRNAARLQKSLSSTVQARNLDSVPQAAVRFRKTDVNRKKKKRKHKKNSSGTSSTSSSVSGSASVSASDTPMGSPKDMQRRLKKARNKRKPKKDTTKSLLNTSLLTSDVKTNVFWELSPQQLNATRMNNARRVIIYSKKSILPTAQILHLNLTHIGMSDVGCLHLTQVIGMNTFLKELILTDNDLTSQSGLAILNTLKSIQPSDSIQIQALILKQNRMGYDFLTAINHIVQRRSRASHTKQIKKYRKELTTFRKMQRNKFSEFILAIQTAMAEDERLRRTLAGLQEDYSQVQQAENSETDQLLQELEQLRADRLLIDQQLLPQTEELIERKAQGLQRDNAKKEDHILTSLNAERRVTQKLRARIDEEFISQVEQEKAESAMDCKPYRVAVEKEQQGLTTAKTGISNTKKEIKQLEKEIVTSYYAILRNCGKGEKELLNPEEFKEEMRLFKLHNGDAQAMLAATAPPVISISSPAEARSALLKKRSIFFGNSSLLEPDPLAKDSPSNASISSRPSTSSGAGISEPISPTPSNPALSPRSTVIRLPSSPSAASTPKSASVFGPASPQQPLRPLTPRLNMALVYLTKFQTQIHRNNVQQNIIQCAMNEGRNISKINGGLKLHEIEQLSPRTRSAFQKLRGDKQTEWEAKREVEEEEKRRKAAEEAANSSKKNRRKSRAMSMLAPGGSQGASLVPNSGANAASGEAGATLDGPASDGTQIVLSIEIVTALTQLIPLTKVQGSTTIFSMIMHGLNHGSPIYVTFNASPEADTMEKEWETKYGEYKPNLKKRVRKTETTAANPAPAAMTFTCLTTATSSVLIKIISEKLNIPSSMINSLSYLEASNASAASPYGSAPSPNQTDLVRLIRERELKELQEKKQRALNLKSGGGNPPASARGNAAVGSIGTIKEEGRKKSSKKASKKKTPEATEKKLEKKQVSAPPALAVPLERAATIMETTAVPVANVSFAEVIVSESTVSSATTSSSYENSYASSTASHHATASSAVHSNQLAAPPTAPLASPSSALSKVTIAPFGNRQSKK